MDHAVRSIHHVFDVRLKEELMWPISVLCRRYLAYHFAPNTDMYKERNAQAFDGLIEAGDHRLLANTAQPPFMPRRRAWQ